MRASEERWENDEEPAVKIIFMKYALTLEKSWYPDEQQPNTVTMLVPVAKIKIPILTEKNKIKNTCGKFCDTFKEKCLVSGAKSTTSFI